MPSRINILNAWVALSASLFALLTGIISFWVAIENRSAVAAQEERITQLEHCAGTTVNLSNPTDGSQVGLSIEVKGTATIDKNCGSIYVVVEHYDFTEKRTWRITDLTQVEKNGSWSATAIFDHITMGGKAKISARLTANSKVYSVGKLSELPLDKGVRSNSVTVRRLIK